MRTKGSRYNENLRFASTRANIASETNPILIIAIFFIMRTRGSRYNEN